MKAKILVIENEGIFTTTLKKRLRDWGYEVSEISSIGEKEILQIQNIDPDLIIMDTFLKGETDCIGVSESIDPKFRTPVIFYSSKIDDKLSKRVKTLPNRYHIQKSSKYLHLKRIIDGILKKVDLNEKEINSIINIYEESLFAQSDIETNSFISEIDNVENPISLNAQNNDLTDISNSNENINSFDEENDLPDVDSVINIDHIDNYVFRKNREEHLKFLKMLIATNFKKQDFYANLKIENTDTGEIIISKKGSDGYYQTRQKLEKELHKAEIYLSKLINKTKEQETEIKQLKDTGETRQKLEKKLQNAEKHITQLLNKIQSQETEIKQLKEKENIKQKLEKELQSAEKQITELLNKTKDQETDYLNLKKELQNSKSQASQLLNKTKEQETEIKQLKDTGETRQKLEKKLRDYKKHLQVLEKKMSDYKKTPSTS
ncbi:MAG TPA: hypothetical protein VK426_05275 [Methanobacterium sp.]|nr:hypothetical protein [Methanobacterium sp.]